MADARSRRNGFDPSRELPAVFTGAGVSAALPSALPSGDRLRDDVLKLCGAHAVALAAESGKPELSELEHMLTDQELAKLPWKLEYVIGRLEGSLGTHAQNVLLALDLWVPNVSHLLLALHLVAQGRQVTLNFDQGVELAYDLLTEHRPSPTKHLTSALEPWIDAARGIGLCDANLTVVATEEEFERWRPGESQSPVLLKLHGTLRGPPGGPLHTSGVVVTEEPELAQLSASRGAALPWLALSGEVLVTGYSGEDIDVYEPLLDAIAVVPSVWAAKSLRKTVIERLRGLGAAIHTGAHNEQARAESQLARIVLEPLGLDILPWPQQPLGSDYPAAFERWRGGVDPLDAAEAFAWMLADAQHYTLAVGLFEVLFARRERYDVRWARAGVRLADGLADMGGRDNKGRAAGLFDQVAARDRSRTGLRSYAFVRWGEQQRHLRDPIPAALSGMRAFLKALLVSFRDRSGASGRARALSAVAHTLLRMVDHLFDLRLTFARRLTLRLASAIGSATIWWALKQASGNRRTFLSVQRVELAAYRALLGGRRLAAHAERTLGELFLRYQRSGDRRGQGNVRAAQAVVARARGKTDQVPLYLDAALEFYTRPDGGVDVSGVQLVNRRKRQLLGVDNVELM